MKKNKVMMPVDADFRDMLKLEAKKKGMTMIGYTEMLAKQDTGIENIMKDWDKKIKKNKTGFDFL